MFQRINERYINKNTILSSEKAYKDSVQLSLNTTQIYSITVGYNDLNISKTIFTVPVGSTYYFLSTSYNGIDDSTNLSIIFPGGFAVSNITAPYGFSSIANPVSEGEVKVLVSSMTPNNNIIINLCILTE